jgi:SAM-dependent methyltransferase
LADITWNEKQCRPPRLFDLMTGYKSDLSYIHDAGFGDFAKMSAPWLLDLLRSYGIGDGLVVDLGCGSGIWARELSRAGYDVLGIDISTSMIAIARKRVPHAEFRTGSLLRATLPKCEAVTALGECFNYSFDESNNLAQVARAFDRVYSALKPGGLFVFDIAPPGRGKGPRQRHRQGKDWAIMTEVDEDTATNRLTRRITTFRKRGRRYIRGEEVHILQLYKKAEILNELRRAGFRVRTVRAYGEQPMIGNCVGFVARKPV